MSTPKWAVGMQRVAPSLYVDRNNAAHWDEDEILDRLKWPKTPQTVEIVRQAAITAFREAFPGTPISFVPNPRDPEEPNGRDRR